MKGQPGTSTGAARRGAPRPEGAGRRALALVWALGLALVSAGPACRSSHEAAPPSAPRAAAPSEAAGAGKLVTVPDGWAAAPADPGPRAAPATHAVDAGPPAPLAKPNTRPVATTAGAALPPDLDALVTACTARQRAAAARPAVAPGKAQPRASAGAPPLPTGAVWRAPGSAVAAAGAQRGPPDPKVFRWTENEPVHLDPGLVYETAGDHLSMQLFETLLVPAPGYGPPRPGQAARYEVSEDGKTWTFHLRLGIVWSDGHPVTAEDFRGAWLRALDPKTGSRAAQRLWFLRGAKAYNQGTSRDPSTVGVRAPDPRTLVVELEAPTPFFPHLVTYSTYAPVPLHVLNAHPKDWMAPAHIVVNGAFTLAEWTRRARVVFRKNPRYWDAAHVALDRVDVTLSDSQERNVKLYEAGKVDLARPVPMDSVPGWVEAQRADLHIDANACVYYLAFQTQRAPFQDPRVRRALQMAVDKERLVRQVLRSYQRPARGLLDDVYRETIGYTPLQFTARGGTSYDPEAARRLLAEAGYPGGRGLGPVELVYNTFEGNTRIAEFVQSNLREALGVDVKPHNVEWKTLLSQANAGDFQLLRSGWCADYPDPLTFLEGLESTSENNYPRYKSPLYDAALHALARETDTARRDALICAAEELLDRDSPVMPLYFYTRGYLVRPYVRGWEPQSQDRHLLKYVSLAPAVRPDRP